MRAGFLSSLLALGAITACLFAGCRDPRLPPRPVGKAPAPPLPPGSPPAPSAPIAGVESAPGPASAAAAANASGLPTDLIAKIDELIQCHQDYIAAAEKVQDPQAAKEQVQTFRERTERSSAIFEDILIASAKLPKDQQAKFEDYMNAHVTQIATQCRQHVHRLEGLLQQNP
jgi:hypothetical protein